MKTRTLLRSRGHNVPIEAYHNHKAEARLRQSLMALSLRSHRLVGELAEESRQWRELGTKPKQEDPPGNPLECDMR